MNVGKCERPFVVIRVNDIIPYEKLRYEIRPRAHPKFMTPRAPWQSVWRRRGTGIYTSGDILEARDVTFRSGGAIRRDTVERYRYIAESRRNRREEVERLAALIGLSR